MNDVPAILAIEQQSPNAAHWTPAQYRTLVASGVVLVAEKAGKLGAFICAKVVAGEWEIENIAVAPEFQRRGIADQLVRALIQRADSAGAASILLEVRKSNLPARRLYEKHEFREEGRRRAYYKDPVEDAVLYTLRLNR
jgi:ribosomal-protein-alanine N-acetyltransferase